MPLNSVSMSFYWDPSCVMTMNSVATTSIKLAYDDRGNAILAAGTSPWTLTPGSGCPAGMTITETVASNTPITLSTPVHDVS